MCLVLFILLCLCSSSKNIANVWISSMERVLFPSMQSQGKKSELDVTQENPNVMEQRGRVVWGMYSSLRSYIKTPGGKWSVDSDSCTHSYLSWVCSATVWSEIKLIFNHHIWLLLEKALAQPQAWITVPGIPFLHHCPLWATPCTVRNFFFLGLNLKKINK